LDGSGVIALPRRILTHDDDNYVAQWLEEAKVNLAMIYHKDIDQWEMKLRNVWFAELPGEDWKTTTAADLMREFPKLKWNRPSGAQAEQKEGGFYTLHFPGGLNPPMYAFTTSDGHRGLLLFPSQEHKNSSDAIQVLYKLLQHADDATETEHDGGKTITAPKAANPHFSPVIEQTLNDISVERNALPPPALNLETGEFLNPPDDIQDFQTAMPWAKANGADIVSCSDGGGRGLRIVGGLAFEPANWDASPQQVAQVTSATERGLNEWEKTIPNFQGPHEMGYSNLWFKGVDKSTFYIKTRSGKMGILQIIGLVDDRRGVRFRYKLLLDASNWSFGPAINRQLLTVSSKLANDSLRLEDGHVFNLPKEFEDMSDNVREKWLSETKVNFAVDYCRDTDQWEFKLRNVTFSRLHEDDWKGLSAVKLQERLSDPKWNDPGSYEADQKREGFAKMVFVTGITPPMTYAFETSEGKRGILQFISSNVTSRGCDVFVRYKLIQQAKVAPSDSATPVGSGEDGTPTATASCTVGCSLRISSTSSG
jgi:hypothetical protein